VGIIRIRPGFFIVHPPRENLVHEKEGYEGFTSEEKKKGQTKKALLLSPHIIGGVQLSHSTLL
jgi:hypothetical protein